MIGTIHDANVKAGKIFAHTAVLKLISYSPMWKSKPARLIGARVPRNLLHNRLGHATAPFNLNSPPVHLREQLFPRSIDVADRFQVNLQRNPGRRRPLLPAALKLFNPVPRKFPLKLPSFSGLCLT